MLPSFLRDSLWTVHREPQLQAHSPHTCQPPLPQSVLTPPIFVHGVSIFLIMSFQGAIPVVCGASTWLAWVPAAQYDWELGPGFAYPLFDTNFYSLNPILFQLLPLIGKRRLLLIVVFFHRSQQGGFSSTILSTSVVPQETGLSHLEICGPGVWQLSTFT